MTNPVKLFTDHPASAGQNYFTHALFAFGVSARLLAATVTAFLHALFRFTFQKITGAIVEDLHAEILRGRARGAALNPTPAPPP